MATSDGGGEQTVSGSSLSRDIVDASKSSTNVQIGDIQDKIGDIQEVGLTEEQVALMRGAFDLFDKDHTGSISVQELGAVMRALGQNPTDAQLQDAMNKFDLNGDGKVDFEDFCALLEITKTGGSLGTEADFRKIFNNWDKDSDGFISAAELKSGMLSLGQNLTDAEVQEMIREADLNGDGVLDFAEFLAIMIIR